MPWGGPFACHFGTRPALATLLRMRRLAKHLKRMMTPDTPEMDVNPHDAAEMAAQHAQTPGADSDTQTPEATAVPEATPSATPESTGPDWQAQFDDMRSKYQYLLADFENARRRNAKERIELMKTAGKDVLTSLLPVVDDFERGLEQMEKATDIDALKAGVQLIYSKLSGILAAQGLAPMQATGQPFDADLHEAIGKLPLPGQEGKVVAEVEKGYKLGEHVIRFAKVMVGE